MEKGMKNKMAPLFVCTVLRNGCAVGTGTVVKLGANHAVVLTAGHLLRQDDGRVEPNAIEVRFLNNHRDFCEKIYGFSLPNQENADADYAVLRVPAKTKGLATAELSPQFFGCNPVQCTNYGIWETRGTVPAPGASHGRIIGPVVPDANAPGDYFLEAIFESPPMEGQSGGPLVIYSGERPVVVGMLTHHTDPDSRQGGERKAGDEARRLIAQALSVERIFRLFPGLRDLVEPHDPWFALRRFAIFNGNVSQVSNDERTVLRVGHREDNFSERVAVKCAKRFKPDKIVKALAGLQNWSKRKKVILPRGFVDRKVPDDEPRVWGRVLDNSLSSIELENLRVMIDSAHRYPDCSWGELPVETSHGLVIRFTDSSGKELIAPGVVSIPGEDEDESAAKAIEFIEDLLVDLNLFHSTPVLPGIFNSLKARQQFETDKLDFLRVRGNIGALTIAGAARDSDSREIDVWELEMMWTEFIQNHMLPPIFQQTENMYELKPRNMRGSDIGEILHAALEAEPKLKGQTSSGKLASAFARRFPKGKSIPKSVFLAVLVGWPTERDDCEALIARFGRRSLHLKHLAFFELAEARGLLRWLGFVRLVAIDLRNLSFTNEK